MGKPDIKAIFQTMDCFLFLLTRLLIQVFISRNEKQTDEFTSGHAVLQQFSNCGPWTSSTGIIWKLMRNANPLAQPQAHESQTSQTLGEEPNDPL